MICCTKHKRVFVEFHCALQECASAAWIEAQAAGDHAVVVLVDREDPTHVAMACMDEAITEMIDGALLSRMRGLANVARSPEPEHCGLPPEGWTCSRERGHPGPCAAHPSYGGLER